MIERIISLSLRNKAFVLFGLVMWIGWGLYSLSKISIGTVPDITNNQVQVITTSRNLATEDIEQFITYPIELEMANLPDVQEIRSISKFGLSVVTIIFSDRMGTWLPRQLIAEKLISAQEKIPQGYGTPEMGPISTGLGEIYQYILDVEPGYEDRYTTMDLRTIQDWIVKRQLSGIPGVVEINTWGGYLKQYEVAVDPSRLMALNVSIGDVFRALEANNENTGGAYIEKNQESYFVRGEGMIHSVADIENTVVLRQGTVPVLIRDVGAVRMGHANRFGAITANGQGEKVMGQIMMLKGANSGQVIEAVKDRVAEVQKNLPEGVRINPFLERSELIGRTTATIAENLGLGALIVVFVVLLLLGNLRSGLIVASVIPLSLLFAIGLMHSIGISADLMSLGAIDFGIIIDGAVIIVEFVLHEFTRRRRELLGLDVSEQNALRDRITMEASHRMMSAAFFGTVIILIVFIPILTLTGIEGKMFRPMALSFGFALLGALVLCLTYVPVMASMFLYRQQESKKDISAHLLKFLLRLYNPSLRLALRFKAAVILFVVVLLTLGVFVFSRLGGEFIPTLDEGDFVVQPILRPGTSLSENIRFCTRVEDILLSRFPEVSQVVSRIGAAEVPTDPMSLEMSDIIVRLKPRKEWVSAGSKEELADRMKEALSIFPGVEFEFTQPIEMRFNELITGVRADLAIKIYGENIDTLYDKALQIRSLIHDLAGASDISVEQVAGLPQMQVKYNREKMAMYGLGIADLNRIVRMSFAGEAAGTIFEGERRFDLVVRFDESYRQGISDLQKIRVELPGGGTVALGEVADIGISRGPAQISRDNTHRRIVIGINVRNRDIESLVNEVQSIIGPAVRLPEGYYVTYGGQFENLRAARERLVLVVPISMILIFVLLHFTFRSILQALMIYTAIPLAAVGGIFLLWLRGMPFSISAGVGFIALFGIATLNGIVLISYFNQLKEEGVKDLVERILLGTRSRMRPVLLTASAAALGFLPMAFSTSAGAEVQRPLATVVIGGLITSTLLTLVVLPVIYLLLNQEKMLKRLARIGLKTLLPLIVCAGSWPLLAQTQNERIGLEQALEIARERNAELRNAALEVETGQSLMKAAWDLGPTEFALTRGQINAANNDRLYNLRQDFGAPLEQASRHRLLKQLVEQQQAGYLRTRRELDYRVESQYYRLLWLSERIELISENYQLYDKAVRIARLKYETGESNLLSKAVMENTREQLRVDLANARADLYQAQVGFKNLLMTDQIYLPAEDSLMVLPAEISRDSLLSGLVRSSDLRLADALRQTAAGALRLEKATISPGIYLGAFRQSIEEFRWFDGWEVGVSFPLWFRPNMGRIQARRRELDVAENSYSATRFQLTREAERLLNQRSLQEEKIGYYRATALPNAALILQNTENLYRNGEIEYLEYIRNIGDVYQIRLRYIDDLQGLNQNTLDILYLTK
jgi:heavy metal efflux system protein